MVKIISARLRKFRSDCVTQSQNLIPIFKKSSISSSKAQATPYFFSCFLIEHNSVPEESTQNVHPLNCGSVIHFSQ